MSYTPGPWRLIPNPHDDEECDVVGPEHDDEHDMSQVIATFYGGAGDAPHGNANLFLAAPALLAACRDALAWRRTGGAIGHSVEQGLEAAIAAATS